MAQRHSVGNNEQGGGDCPTGPQKPGIQTPVLGLEEHDLSSSPRSAPTFMSQDGSANTLVEPSPGSPHRKTDEDARYVTGYKLAGLVTGMTVVIFLIYLDNSIISTATPVITADLHETADIGWYAGAYTLVSGTLQPMAGKLYTYFRKQFVFLAFLFVFEAGSLICALAHSSPMLIAGRAVAGAGSSGLMNGAWTIIGFYINLPIGACAAVLVLFHAIPDTNGMDAFSFAFVRRTLSSLDLGGFALLAPAMAMFLAALQFGSDTKYAWNSSLIIGLFCGAGVAAVLFVLWECRVGDTAIIPGSVVRRREVWSSCGHIFSMSFVVFIANYFLPVYFQAVKGVGPTLSGLYLLPGILGQLSFVLLSGAAVSKLGYFMPWCLFGGVMIAVGGGLTTTFGPNTNTGQWIGYQLMHGIGRGAAMTMPLTAIQCALDEELVALAMSLLIFCQNLAGSVAVIIATTIFTQSLLKDLPILAPSASPEAAIRSGTGAGAVRGLLPVGSPELDGLLRAYSYAVDKTFYVVAGFGATSIGFAFFMGWKDVRKAKAKIAESNQGKIGEQEVATV
ncbi:ac2ce0b2-0f2c-4d86-9ef6-6ef02f7d8a90 [Thermothielavioides terrestris]|uniref:Ac2ce0b2-0f2c-4d86-9ef6-6ef02f7d8a90 n=1 Tax=Thermothielavioides terrestris TaxID=2587410 RepID=A0A446BDW0_9PEZI|nr:ac2ce0b2-0f2c-4d86-9ef6-6ef02f7d8a90 [Thermothielavioides terrestris]